MADLIIKVEEHLNPTEEEKYEELEK